MDGWERLKEEEVQDDDYWVSLGQGTYWYCVIDGSARHNPGNSIELP